VHCVCSSRTGTSWIMATMRSCSASVCNMRFQGRIVCSVLTLGLLQACGSTGNTTRDMPMPDGVTARVELSSRVVDAPRLDSSLTAVFADADLFSSGSRMISDDASEILPAFLQDSKTTLSALWTGEGELVSRHADKLRAVSARRILTFRDLELARECFPGAAEDAFVPRSEDPGGGVDVVSAEILFHLIRSQDGGALRFRLERIFARRSELPVSRLLPNHDEPVPIVVSLTIRFAHAGEESSHTVLFAETIDITESDFEATGSTTDWMAVRPGSLPHSLHLGMVGRDEIDGWARTVRDSGLSLYGLASRIRRASGI